MSARLNIDLEQFQFRLLQDAIAAASAQYWWRRASTFAAVGTPGCDEIATACANHARLIADFVLPAWEDVEEDIAEVLLGEAA